MEQRSADRKSWLTRYVQETRQTTQTTPREAAEPCQDLVLSNLGFVVKIAYEYRNRGLEFGDLLNEGNVGLIEAAQHFDPARGNKFITYAVWWIRKSILKALAQHATLVRVPGYQLKKVRHVRDAGRTLSRKLGREPDREEISREMRVTVAKIDAALQLRMRELSLDDKIGPNKDIMISDTLVDGRSMNPEAELIKRESRNLVHHTLRLLTVQEQTVIVNRFGLEDGRIFTLREIGVRLGVSRERVRQLECLAKKRLRRQVAQHSAKRQRSRTRGIKPPGRPKWGTASDASRGSTNPRCEEP